MYEAVSPHQFRRDTRHLWVCKYLGRFEAVEETLFGLCMEALRVQGWNFRFPRYSREIGGWTQTCWQPAAVSFYDWFVSFDFQSETPFSTYNPYLMILRTATNLHRRFENVWSLSDITRFHAFMLPHGRTTQIYSTASARRVSFGNCGRN